MRTIADLNQNNSDIYVSPAELAERKRIEGEHSQHDDGSNVFFAHAVGIAADYDDGSLILARLPSGWTLPVKRPLDDHDHSVRLCEWGLPQHDQTLLERNDCFSIADVRSAVLNPEEIPGWFGAGETVRANVLAALKKADEENDCR